MEDHRVVGGGVHLGFEGGADPRHDVVADAVHLVREGEVDKSGRGGWQTRVPVANPNPDPNPHWRGLAGPGTCGAHRKE